jgi:hydrogenase/urease accessory protein HupE
LRRSARGGIACRIAGACAGLLLSLLATGEASAHRTSLASLDATVLDRGVSVALTLSAHDLAIAIGLAVDLDRPVPLELLEAHRSELESYVASRVSARAGDLACPPESVALEISPGAEDVGVNLRLVCPEAIERLTLDYKLFFEIDPDHVAIGRFIQGDLRQELLFDRSVTVATMAVDRPAPDSWAAVFQRFLLLGVEHILIGYDHILFLLALIIGANRLWPLVKVVTAFTIAHSLTLGLAWFDLIALPSRLVESLIALSIAVVAVLNLTGAAVDRRWAIAGAFGLVHGLGFFGVLQELGPPADRPVATLLAFNLGVEIGQLAIVAATFLPLLWWSRQSWFRSSARLASIAILAVAAWWFAERAAIV